MGKSSRHPRKPKKIKKLSNVWSTNALKQWFSTLTAEERQLSIAIEDSEWAELVRNVGRAERALNGALWCHYRGACDPVAFRDLCPRRLDRLERVATYPEFLKQLDLKFVKSVRLGDTQAYADTVTLSIQDVQSDKRFWQLMNSAARGSFATNVCLVEWTRQGWRWQPPKWFQHMGYFTLATLLASKFERALWASFAAAKRLDPRVKGAQARWNAPRHNGLRSKSHLIPFWQQLSSVDRGGLGRTKGDIVQHVVADLATEDNEHTPRDVYLTMLSSLVSLNGPPTPSSMTKALTDDDKMLKNDNDVLSDPHFVEMLFFSPLERAGQARDLVLRRIGRRLQSAYSSGLSLDLMGPKEKKKTVQEDVKEATTKKATKENPLAMSDDFEQRPQRKEDVRPTQLHQQHRLLQKQRKEESKGMPIRKEASIETSLETSKQISTQISKETSKGNQNKKSKLFKSSSLSEQKPREQHQHQQPSKPSSNPNTPQTPHRRRAVSLTGNEDVDKTSIKRRDSTTGNVSQRRRAPSDSNVSMQSPSDAPDEGGWQVVRRRRRAASPPARPKSNMQHRPILRRTGSSVVVKPNTPSMQQKSRPWREVAATADDWSVGSTPDGRWSTLSLSKRRLQQYKLQQLQKQQDELLQQRGRVLESSVPHGFVSPPRSPDRMSSDEGESIKTKKGWARSPHAISSDSSADKKHNSTDNQRRRAHLVGGATKTESFNWPSLSSAREHAKSSRYRRRAPPTATEDDWSIGIQHSQSSQTKSSASRGPSHPKTSTPDRHERYRQRQQQLESKSARRLRGTSFASPLSPQSAPFVATQKRDQPALRSIPGMELIIGAFNRVRRNVEQSPRESRSSSVASLSPRSEILSSPSFMDDDWFSEIASDTSSVSSFTDDVLSESGDSIASDRRPVWMPTHRRHYIHPRMDIQLHVEIEDFVCFVYACFLSRLNRQQAMIQRIRAAVARTFTNAQVEVFGSYSTCLSIPSSDLDLVVIVREPDQESTNAPMSPKQVSKQRPLTTFVPHEAGKPEGAAIEPHNVSRGQGPHPALGPMRKLAKELQEKGGVLELKAIETAFIPIIKLQTEPEKIPTDITFNVISNVQARNATHSGLAARDLVKNLLGKLPPLGALSLVAKQMLHERGLNDTFGGGLGSYCLVLLIAVFLSTSMKQQKLISSPQTQPRHAVRLRSNSNPASPDLGGGSRAMTDTDDFAHRKTLGTLLLDLCDFYGSRFDPATTGAAWSIGRGCGLYFPLANQGPAPLVLLDPYNEQRNIAHNVFQFYRVRQVFAEAAIALRAKESLASTRISRIIRLSREDLITGVDENCLPGSCDNTILK